MLGNVIVYREVRGNTIMANRPKKPESLTAHQEMIKSRFLKAVQYARKQLQNEATKAEYAARITASKFSAYAVALTDYLTPPEVTEVNATLYHGQAGEIITIKASDDFKVASVAVIITDGAGTLIEQGAATMVPESFDEWQYITTVANGVLAGSKITAKATDKPGNAGIKEIVL